MDRIRVDGLEIFCNHGVYREENVLGQKFLVDAELYLSVRKAGLSDELQDSVSYGDVCRLIDKEMKRQNDKLLERVAERVAEKLLLTFPLVDKVNIEIKKPWAPVRMHINYASVTVERGWHRVYVGAGSNMGDRKSYLDEAARALQEDDRIRDFRAAAVIETKPWGFEEQDDFLNTVYGFATLYEPEELLRKLQEIENAAGRVREIHWGPRTLDLDILLYDELVTETPELMIPHPELTGRLFVLEPLCQLNPYGVHPLYKKRYIDYKRELESVEQKSAAPADADRQDGK